MDQTSRKLEVRRLVTFLLQKHKQETVKIFHHDGESAQEETEQKFNGYINRV